MASVFSYSETYGTSPGTTADTSYINLLGADVASGNATNHQNYTIGIPPTGTRYSYERYVRGRWTGTFTSISNVKFWKSAGTLATGCTLNGGDKGNQTYASPVSTVSAVAISPSADWDSEAEAFTLGYSGNYSDYVVLQMAIESTASAGAVGQITYKMQWDET